MANKTIRTPEQCKAISDRLTRQWNDEKWRKKVLKGIRKSWKKRKKHKTLPDQRKDYAGYQYGVQQEFRKQHPNYYKHFSHYRKAKSKGFMGSFKEWCEQNKIDPMK